jgi:hypothetical protein
MATYLEIWGLTNDPTLAQKVAAACLVAAEAIRQEPSSTPNNANRLKWAKRALADPAGTGAAMLRAVLGANAAATVAQINGSTDATILTAVNNAVNVFADGT